MNIPATLLCDFYKVSHREQYPQGTEFVYSTFTPRNSRVKGVNEVVAFGFQGFILKYLVEYFEDNFFNRDWSNVEYEYTRVMKYCLNIKNPYTNHLKELHDLGYLPIEIKAVAEGTCVPMGVPVLTIENTDPRFFWLTNYLETLMSCEIWKSMTSATTALQYRRILDDYAMKTSDCPEMVDFQAHDFSMRGMGCVEDAMLSGIGHLTSFKGTDTIPAILYAEAYYNCDITNEFVAGSVPATEHSVTMAGGMDEYKTFKRLLTEVYPTGIVSCVSDTWNLWNVLTKILPSLKNEIMSRDGKAVCRPDCYDDITEIYTDNGWKYFKDLTVYDLVAAVTDDNTYHFEYPTNYVEQTYNGDMYSFAANNKNLEFSVTPNHRMIYSKNGKIGVDSAENYKTYYEKNMIRSAKALLGGYNALTPIERLKIAFQADGSYCTKNKNAIRFSFSKERKIERLVNIIELCGFQYKIYELKDGRKEIHIKTPSCDYLKDFSWVDISSLHYLWCQEFIDELSYWDATRRSDSRFKFDTCVPCVADVVQIIAMSAGYGVTYTSSKDTRKTHFSDVHTLHILKNNMLGGQSIVKTKKEYNGKVYCVQVSTGKLLVRRNKQILVSGNSGDPVDILCGDPNGEIEEEHKGVVELLWETFGGTINSKGYKELDSHVGAIYGDAITPDRCIQICERLSAKGFASTNVVFGVGSYSYQMVTRDTYGFALKATDVIINGVEHLIYKDPITDKAKFKKSQKGRVVVLKDDNNKLYYVDNLTKEDVSKYTDDLLKPIFRDGSMLENTSLSKIRENIKKN